MALQAASLSGNNAHEHHDGWQQAGETSAEEEMYRLDDNVNCFMYNNVPFQFQQCLY